ncbi:transposase, partial [Psychromonas arctica]
NITVNKGMNKFTLRGQDKVNTQWQMYCLVHNIEKLRNSLH